MKEYNELPNYTKEHVAISFFMGFVLGIIGAIIGTVIFIL